MTIIEPKRKISRFRVIAALSMFGLIFTAVVFVFLKKHHIYEHEYEFGRNITAVIFIASVIVPLAYYVLELLNEKVLAPLAGKFSYHIHQRRIKKYGHKKVSREDKYKQRIMKVLGPYLACHMMLTFLYWFALVFLVLGIRRLQLPEVNLDNDAVSIISCVISFPVAAFLSSIIAVHIFKKKKGVKKALKYVVGLKKQPRFFTRFWLKICGIGSNDIQNYLSGINKQKPLSRLNT